VDNAATPLQKDAMMCLHCQNPVQSNDRFCGKCGKQLFELSQPLPVVEDVFAILTPSLLYYGITLLILSAFKLTPLFPEGFEGMLWISVIDLFLVLAFWGYYFEELKPLYSISNLKVKLVLLTMGGAIVGSVLVSVVADFINISLSDDVFYDTYLFGDTAYPLSFAILFIAVYPAIFEEVAFRGFMFNNIKQVTSVKSVVYITSFVFGIIHLSIISMMWLVPIGLVFAWLRMKYNTLWYGMIGHFTYNLCITLMEYYRIAL
jgi:uncharacterized protein